MKHSISDIKKIVIPILKSYGVKRAAFFGSLVRGGLKEDSDIDILIKFKGNKSLLDLIDLKFKLENALGRNVDVLTYDSIHPLLKNKILKEQKVIL